MSFLKGDVPNKRPVVLCWEHVITNSSIIRTFPKISAGCPGHIAAGTKKPHLPSLPPGQGWFLLSKLIFQAPPRRCHVNGKGYFAVIYRGFVVGWHPPNFAGDFIATRSARGRHSLSFREVRGGLRFPFAGSQLVSFCFLVPSAP